MSGRGTFGLCFLAIGALTSHADAQSAFRDHVLTFRAPAIDGRPLPLDRQAAGVWHRLLKVRTTASVLHTTAHPDDEHVGLLTRLSRGEGARTALLSLNRGEGGANAIGPELFDALGVVRAEELRLAGAYYGLDDLYFTNAVDYGFSKSLDEARRSWDFEAVLEDMVRIIRINRPLVVVSRWHGSERDGHGHHQAAGVLTPLAVAAAADSTRFPHQIQKEGIRPWSVRKVYRGGVREVEATQLRYDAGIFDPRVGATYEDIGRVGVSVQRSQTAGRLRRGRGAAHYRYNRLTPAGRDVEEGFFDGLDVSLSGLPTLYGEDVTSVVHDGLAALESAVDAVVRNFDWQAPARSVPNLVAALRHADTIIPLLDEHSDVLFALRIKRRQLIDATVSAAGFSVSAQLAPPIRSPAVLAGGTIPVEVTVGNPVGVPASLDSVRFSGKGLAASDDLASDRTLPLPAVGVTSRYSVTMTRNAVTHTNVSRPDIWTNHYVVHDSSDLYLPAAKPALLATVWLTLANQSVDISVSVRSETPNFPDGFVYPQVYVVPAVFVAMDPALLLLPAVGTTARDQVDVTVTSNAPDVSGTVVVRWSSRSNALSLARSFVLEEPGEAQVLTFDIAADSEDRTEGSLEALAVVANDTIRGSVETIRHDALEWRPTVRRASTAAHVVDVMTRDGLTVGYIMGVGDDVPAAIERLGATVRLLDEDDLAGSLDAFDAVVIGTRAYAVREDLIQHNANVVAYARRGGHVIVLYQTQEFVPDVMAPFPADLPNNAEEVSQEDAAVEILAPDHPMLSAPNRIAEEDFDGWVEQRGSKFFSRWSEAFVPLIQTHDMGQTPQRGVWLTASVGDGHYTYVALALHRQLPYGIGGAYRILANLISMGSRP